MTLTFTVGAVPYQFGIPDGEELLELGERVSLAVEEASGGAPLHRYLQARILDAVLNALTEHCDQDLGEVLSA